MGRGFERSWVGASEGAEVDVYVRVSVREGGVGRCGWDVLRLGGYSEWGCFVKGYVVNVTIRYFYLVLLFG